MHTVNPVSMVMLIGMVIIIFGVFFKLGNEPAQQVSTNSGQAQATYVSTPAKPVAVSNISNAATNVPPPVLRTENEVIKIELEAVQLVAELADGTTYEYWTFNKTVPGPFIRVMEGDTVEVSVFHSHDHTALNDAEIEEEKALFHL